MVNQEEIWRPVEGYEGYYEVSSHGRVRRVAPGRGTRVGRLLKPCLNKNGYWKVALCKGCKTQNVPVHRLIAQGFIPNPDNLPEIDHINADKTDNRIENLRWCTHVQNMTFAAALGLMGQPAGELNGRSKLTERQVLEIRARAAIGKINKTKLGAEFGVHRSVILDIVRREKWRHI